MKTAGISTDIFAWILDKPKTGKTFPETVGTQDYNKNNIKLSSSRNSDESRNQQTQKFLSRHPEAVAGIYAPAKKSWGSADDPKAARWIYGRLLIVNSSLSEPNWAE